MKPGLECICTSSNTTGCSAVPASTLLIQVPQSDKAHHQVHQARGMELQLQELATTRRSDPGRFERAHRTSDTFSRLSFQHTKPQLKPLYSTPVLTRLSSSAGRSYAVKSVIFSGNRGGVGWRRQRHHRPAQCRRAEITKSSLVLVAFLDTPPLEAVPGRRHNHSAQQNYAGLMIRSFRCPDTKRVARRKLRQPAVSLAR